MSVTQRLMKPGGFDIQLRPDTPYAVRAEIQSFDHVVITPSRLQGDVRGFSDSDVLGQALYTGVLTNRPSSYSLSGYDLSYWLATPDGLGDTLETPVTLSGGTLSQWITALCPSSLVVGTVTNTGLGTLSNTYHLISRREAIDAVCRYLGAEWRVNPNFTIDAAKALFVTTPTVVVTRNEEGPDGHLLGLDGSLVQVASDVEQYTTRALVAASQGSAVSVVGANGTTTYRDGRNNLVVMKRLVSAPTEPNSNSAALAAATVAQWNQDRREVSLSSRTHTIARNVKPGDWVWAYDINTGLIDTANEIAYRGRILNPAKVRVYALAWPIQAPMGVYVRRSTGSAYVYTDISEWVVPDGGEVKWDVGLAPRALNDVSASMAGGSAYLGANADVAARAAAATNKNVVLNSGPDIWQRGTSITYSNAFGFTADRWFMYGYGTGATGTLARYTHSAGGSEAYGGTKYYLNYAWNYGSDTVNNLNMFQVSIDDVRTFAGKPVTISFWANSNGNPQMGMELEQQFGSGGSPSGGTLTNIGVLSLSTTPTRYVLTTTLPSINGKTIGTDENSELRLNFWVSAGSAWSARAGIGRQAGTYYVNVWGVKVEEGSVATAYVRPDQEHELLECQRYLQVYNDPPLRGVVTTATAVSRAGMVLVAPMRGVPTVSISGTVNWYDGSATTTGATVFASYHTPRSLEFDFTVAGALTANRPAVLFNNFNSSIFVVSAE